MTDIPDDDGAGNGGRHTPGPWSFIHSDPTEGVECFWIKVSRSFGPITRGFRVVDIASVNGPQWAEQEANARLIASAPELLAALEAAVECRMVPTSSAREGGAVRHARQAVVADMIRDAIAKARGRE